MSPVSTGVAVALALLSIAGAALFCAARLERRGRGGRFGVFAARRLGLGLLTLMAVFTLTFLLIGAVPGGPFDDDRGLDENVRASLEARFGLDDSAFERWARAMAGLPSLDFGPSLVRRGYEAREIVLDGLPVSVALTLGALLVSLGLGLPAGRLAAARKGRFADRGVLLLSAVGLSLPPFVLASLGMLPLVFALAWLPPSGLDQPTSLILPILCLGLPLAAQVARLHRSALLEALGASYVRTAKAKGLDDGTILRRHAAPAALAPVVAWLGPAVANLVTGSLVIERVFALPGLGTHFVESALGRDATLALACVTVYTLAILISNAGADLLLAKLDPRVTPS